MSNFLEVLRYASVLLGTLLLGTNFAFIFQAERLFAAETVKFWRIFFIGKSIITAYLCWSVYTAVASPYSKAIVASLGVGISLYALAYLYKERLFYYAKIKREREIGEQAVEEARQDTPVPNHRSIHGEEGY